LREFPPSEQMPHAKTLRRTGTDEQGGNGDDRERRWEGSTTLNFYLGIPSQSSIIIATEGWSCIYG